MKAQWLVKRHEIKRLRKFPVGSKWGLLTIIEHTVRERDQRLGDLHLVRCRCDCGKETITRPSYLANGNTTSCGCRRAVANEAWKTLNLGKVNHMAIGRYLFFHTKRGAHQRGIEFSLTEEQFLSMAVKSCVYCGASPREHRYRTSYGHFNGIDRLDSSSGYTPENCVPCCKICNHAKCTMSVSEFLEWAGKVVSLGRQKQKKTIVEINTDILPTDDQNQSPGCK